MNVPEQDTQVQLDKLVMSTTGCRLPSTRHTITCEVEEPYHIRSKYLNEDV